MPLSELTADRVSDFIPLAQTIHETAWPSIPFSCLSAAHSMLQHIGSPTATILVIDEGDSKAMLMLDTAPLMGNALEIVAIETAWGSTKSPPKHAGKRLIEAAKVWAIKKNIIHLVINLGDRKGAPKFIQKNGGQVLHTAGYWRL